MKFSAQNSISLDFIIVRPRNGYKSIITNAHACTFTLNAFESQKKVILLRVNNVFELVCPKFSQNYIRIKSSNANPISRHCYNFGVASNEPINQIILFGYFG